MKEKLYKIYYDLGEQDYVVRYLKDDEIINGFLTEAKAFDIFFTDMIMCNEYFKNDDFSYIDELVSAYDEDEDYYEDEYQFFIVNPCFDEDLTIKAVKLMGNTLYYDNQKDLYITGITDLGTSRTIVPTQLRVEEIKEA